MYLPSSSASYLVAAQSLLGPAAHLASGANGTLGIVFHVVLTDAFFGLFKRLFLAPVAGFLLAKNRVQPTVNGGRRDAAGGTNDRQSDEITRL